jgi:hypothetical protein
MSGKNVEIAKFAELSAIPLNADELNLVSGGTISLNYGTIEWVYTQQKRADGTGTSSSPPTK